MTFYLSPWPSYSKQLNVFILLRFTNATIFSITGYFFLQPLSLCYNFKSLNTCNVVWSAKVIFIIIKYILSWVTIITKLCKRGSLSWSRWRSLFANPLYNFHPKIQSEDLIVNSLSPIMFFCDSSFVLLNAIIWVCNSSFMIIAIFQHLFC